MRYGQRAAGGNREGELEQRRVREASRAQSYTLALPRRLTVRRDRVSSSGKETADCVVRRVIIVNRRDVGGVVCN